MALSPELDHVTVLHPEPDAHVVPEKINGEGGLFTFQEKWGFPVEEVYKLALRFYKEKAGKAPLQIPYGNKLRMVAYTNQVKYGPFKPSLVPDVGFLDVVGRDRRQTWLSLGEMSKEDAMLRFVDLLDILCPLFKPYIEAHKRDREDRDRKERDDDEDRRKKEDDERMSMSSTTTFQAQPIQLSLEQEQQIRDALNNQTQHQFKAFCEQQLPGKVEEQKALIAKLQEEHFQQYMKHWMEYQASNGDIVKNGDAHQIVDEQSPVREDDMTSEGDNEDAVEGTAQGSGVGGQIQAASVWSRKDLKEFKESVKHEGGEGILKIGQGETVTIRVPTHPEGNYLFWEFATDHYDLGFGLFFEWSNNTNDNRVTIHVSETDEDDEEFEGPERPNDPEKGGSAANQPPGPPVDEILPVYRRDCHEEVVAGSHLYPARQGVYLLKFDNSFSLWRSKTLYYRVYYTR